MSRLQLVSFNGLEQLRDRHEAWDDLWRRSLLVCPTFRAEIVAQWIEQFVPSGRWQAFAVADGDKLVAAMVLVAQRMRGLEIGGLAFNPWCRSGELLLDPNTDADAALDVLVEAIDKRMAWPLARLDSVPIAEANWQAFLAACQRRGMPCVWHPSYAIAQVELVQNWADYEASWSGNHRRQMRKARKRAERDGALELVVQTEISSADIPALLERGFQVEDRSWKSAEGSSVLRSPGMLDFYIRQAQHLAAWRQLALVFLRQDGRDLAFEFGYVAKRTYFSAKVGYDEAFAAYSPGQLLRLLMLRYWHDCQDVGLVDFYGPEVQTTAKWATRNYAVGRLTLAPRRPLSVGMWHAFQIARRAAALVRRRRSEVAEVSAQTNGDEQNVDAPVEAAV